MENNKLLTIDELATYLAVRKSYIYNNIGLFPHLKIGKLLRFRKEDVDNWLKTFEVQPISTLVCTNNKRSVRISPIRSRAYRKGGRI
jgi:excisionase family DNA binding protein